MEPVDLKGLTLQETTAWARSLNLEAYRAAQIRRWIFTGLAGSFDEMSDLARPLRERLKGEATLGRLSLIETLTSADTTRKYLFELHDGHLIEAVLIPERGHLTLCVSSQAGCGMGCRFCATGQQGLKRNLSAAEIVEQVIEVKRSLERPQDLTNLVFMGMGEPLANYDELLRALGNLTGADGMNMSHRKVTVSTSGLVPQMRRLGRDIAVNLAVSLNAADDATRAMLMPIDRTYPIRELLGACRDFPLPPTRRISFEYILIEGINDREKDARNLCGLLRGLRAKINLIALNPHQGSPFRPPSKETVLRFQEILLEAHYTAIVRKSKGRDILAACGQLSGARAA